VTCVRNRKCLEGTLSRWNLDFWGEIVEFRIPNLGHTPEIIEYGPTSLEVGDGLPEIEEISLGE